MRMRDIEGFSGNLFLTPPVGPSPLILKGARRNFLAECFPRKIVAFPSPTQDILSTRSLSSAQPATWYRLIKMA